MATLTAGATTVSLEFRFDSTGRNVSVYTERRFYDDGKSPPVERPWEARSLQFDRTNGMIVATEAVVLWHMPSGEFSYWRGRPTAIEYRYGDTE